MLMAVDIKFDISMEELKPMLWYTWYMANFRNEDGKRFFIQRYDHIFEMQCMFWGWLELIAWEGASND